MVKITDTLMACEDCLFYVANGDLPDGNPYFEDAIRAAIGVPSGWLCVGDSDADEEFSWAPCECCGSQLGGSRHQLVLLSK